MTHNDHAGHLERLAGYVATKAVVAVGLAGIALIHLLDSIGKYHETRYIFWMYVGLMISSLAIGGWLLVKASRTAWLAAGGLAASVLLGFVLNRTIGLPNATGDIGNWTEPIGLASMFVEGAVIAASGLGLRLHRDLRAQAPVPLTVASSDRTIARAAA